MKHSRITTVLFTFAMFVIAAAILRLVGTPYGSVLAFAGAGIFAVVSGALWRATEFPNLLAPFVYGAAMTLVFFFFAVTYPYGFAALGWTLFYGLWYAGLAAVIGAGIILALPYLRRTRIWEVKHMKPGWVVALFVARS